MINIRDTVFVNVKIDGVAIEGAHLISSITLSEGTPVMAPSAMIVFNDLSGNMSGKQVLTDGNSIVVAVGKTPDDLKTVTRQYRLFSTELYHSTTGPSIKALALYDAPKWTIEAASVSISGTSSQALQQIAYDCALSYDGPESYNGRSLNDSQVWLSVGRTRGGFAQREIAAHGYIDDNSAMYAALTSLGVLKYRNLMDLVTTKPEDVKYLFAHNIPEGSQNDDRQTYKVAQVLEHSDAGLVNTSMNYGAVRVTSGVSGTDAVESSLDVKTNASYLAINDQIAQTVKVANLSHSVWDCGNVHGKYYRAEYQNRRQAALFSERQSLLVNEPTEVQLFDVVIYKQADADMFKPVRNTDIYVVVGKTIHIPGGRDYFERIEIVRMSITEKGEAELKSAEPTSARESSVPDTQIDTSVTTAANMVTTTKGITSLLSPIESSLKSLRQSAAKVLNNGKLTIPGLSSLSKNIKGFTNDVNSAVATLKMNVNSIQQLKQTYESFKTDFESVSNAVRDGNLSMIASGLSSVARSAAYFRPEGVAASLSSVFGITDGMRGIAEVYNTSAAYLATVKSQLASVEELGSIVDQSIADMTSVVNSYNSNVASLAKSYNSLIHTVTGESPNLQTPNLELNRSYFGSLMAQSITPVASSFDTLTVSVPTVQDVQRNVISTLRTRDDTRNYLWAPESGYSPTILSLDDLSSAVVTADARLTNAEQQTDDYDYSISNGA